MARRRSGDKTAWIVGLSALGLLIGGGIAYAATRPAAPAATLPPIPAPGSPAPAPGSAVTSPKPPTPGGGGPASSSQAAVAAAAAAAGPPAPNPTDVVTDPGAIAAASQAFTTLASKFGIVLQPGTSVDANPAAQDANFIAVLKTFQASPLVSVVPALRADGVLDWRSWAAGVLDAGLTVPGGTSTPVVTDPLLLKMAAAAANVLSHKPQATSMGIKPGYDTTQIIAAVEGWLLQNGASGIPTDGSVTYFILALLIAQAYGTP